MSELRIIGTAGHSMKAIARWKVLGTNSNEALVYVKSPALAHELTRLRAQQTVFAEALTRAERKLSAYVGVCKGDKELTGTVLPMCREALATLDVPDTKEQR